MAQNPKTEPIYVTREELQNAIAELREERERATEALVATCVYACAKAWLPDYPEHVSKAMLWLELHAHTACDPAVAGALERTLEILGEIRPSYEPEYELRLAATH